VSEFEPTEFTSGDSPKPEREGLPAGYRMRADPHYVELLSTPAKSDRGRGEASRTRDDQPGLRAARDRRLFEQLSEDINAIESASAMLSADPSPLARRVSLDLIKAQSARAGWLLRAHGLSAGADPDPATRTRPMGALLAQLRDRVSAECRLVGLSLHVATDDQTPVTIDDVSLLVGLTGAVLALAGVAASGDGGSIRVQPIVVGGELQAIEITEDGAPLASSGLQRFFDPSWTDRPGGWLAAMGASTARLAAERLGGTASIAALDRRGATVKFVVKT
jgi:hypothetical protein